MSVGKRGTKKVIGCSLFKTRGEDPTIVISEILKRSGVKVGKIDRQANQITGKIGSFRDPHACRITANVYSQKSMSLVELVCEGAWGRPGKKVLSAYLKMLCHNFDDLSLEDVERSIDWGKSEPDGKGSHRPRTQAVALIQNIEAEMR